MPNPIRTAIAALFIAGSAFSHANNLVLEAGAMDRSADPCSNFYQYANGNWLANHPVPADRARYGAYDEVFERNLTALKNIIETAAKSNSANPSVQKVGAFYLSGMDEARLEAEGAKPLAEQLARISAIKTQADLIQVLAQLHKEGINPLFDFNVSQDAKNSLRYIMDLSQGGLGLPDRDYYLKTDSKHQKLRRQYKAHLVQIFGLLGDSPQAAEKNAIRVIRLETGLARASMTKVEQRNPEATYHLLNLNGLQKISPHFAWQAYFEAIGVSKPSDINVSQPKFFSHISQAMGSVPSDDLKTYLRWHLAHAQAKYLSSDFVNADFAFYSQTLTGAKELRPRWKRVLKSLDQNLGEALGELYVAEYFSPAAKTEALEMLANIKLAMAERIKNSDWMSAVTKEQALKKLDKVVVKIGYPDIWRDYSSLQITKESYAANIRRGHEFEFKRQLAKLGKEIDRNEWGMTPSTVNAYYNPGMNEMVFPAGILQAPLFHVNADSASNYGNTGATIGHELIHAFDDEGSQFDGDGNLKSWWTKEDRKNFTRRVTRIEKQFDEFNPLDKLHINGKLTAGENIADLGGLTIAFQALKKSLVSKPQAEKIDGLSQEQRFFIANAQSFRSNTRPEELRLQILTDPHAPEKYRVIAPIANMPAFAAAFSCDKSALRSEDKRVNIW
ncbi:M13 family metallopeptidase [Iodobacter sp. HSC-16F04]|uniref:M13 family metallopeptidase n=1 Tax=Iodobacter violaceini TaxID=3044271 RepID=A0ABX0KXU0_9NEIS|nr:M13 family metallopeptidase [Iodobacter violacea]NHQ86929.1 M13 family metallopeptidase [Iodobacter violacea]